MKSTIVLVFFITSFTSLSQSRKGVLSDIRNKYQLIRELVDTNTLRQHHTEYSCDEAIEKGGLTFYYNGNELKHIIHTYTKGHVKFRDEFYIWDDELFFQYAIHKISYKDYEKNYSGRRQLVNVILTLEERFYFEERNVIKCQFKDFENRNNRPKEIKTNNVKNVNVDCDQAQNALKKFDILLRYQNIEIKDACNLPKSITKTEPLDGIYGNIDSN